MAEAYPSKRTVEPASGSVRPAPHRVVPALWGDLSPSFTHPSPSAIRHPAEGTAAGLWVKGQGFMGRARQQGWEAAAGRLQEPRIWRRLGIDGAARRGLPRRKGCCIQL